MGPPAAVAAAAALPEVAEAGAPRRLVRVGGGRRARGRLVVSALPGARDRRPPARDRRPAPARAGEVTLNRALALGMGLGPGDPDVARGRAARRSSASPCSRSPSADGWVTPAQVGRAHARAARGGRAVDRVGGRRRLRLRDPDAAAAVAQRLAADGRVRVSDWLEARSDFTDESRRTLAILGAATLLALLAAGFTLATAIGGRVLADRRRIGLLRAVGVTPARGHRRARRPLPDARAARRAGRPARRLAAGAAAAGRHARAARHAAARAARPGARGARARCSCWPPWRWRARCRPGAPAGCRRSSRSQPVRAGDRSGRRARRGIARALRLPVTAALGAKDAYVQRGRAVLTVASLALAARDGGVRAGVRGHDGPPGRRPVAARAAVGGGRVHRLDAGRGGRRAAGVAARRRGRRPPLRGARDGERDRARDARDRRLAERLRVRGAGRPRRPPRRRGHARPRGDGASSASGSATRDG